MTKTSPKPSMEDLLARLPSTGITKGVASNKAAEIVAIHPDTWEPLILTSRGRPKRGEETGSVIKSIRLPENAWALIEKKAVRLNLPVHAALRKAVLDWAVAPDECAPPLPVPAPSPAIQNLVVVGPAPPWATSDAASYVGFPASDPGSGPLRGRQN